MMRLTRQQHIVDCPNFFIRTVGVRSHRSAIILPVKAQAVIRAFAGSLITCSKSHEIVIDYAWLERTASGKYIEHEIPDCPSSERRGLQVANARVYDVDNDGDNDIIWPRAHNYGGVLVGVLRWSETHFQTTRDLGGPTAVHHPLAYVRRYRRGEKLATDQGRTRCRAHESRKSLPSTQRRHYTQIRLSGPSC